MANEKAEQFDCGGNNTHHFPLVLPLENLPVVKKRIKNKITKKKDEMSHCQTHLDLSCQKKNEKQKQNQKKQKEKTTNKQTEKRSKKKKTNKQKKKQTKNRKGQQVALLCLQKSSIFDLVFKD